jgi:hypothetical protein
LTEADEGTRTLDLLHGKRWRAFVPVRLSSPKLPFAAASIWTSERHRTRTNAECSHCSHCDRCHVPGFRQHAYSLPGQRVRDRGPLARVLIAARRQRLETRMPGA